MERRKTNGVPKRGKKTGLGPYRAHRFRNPPQWQFRRGRSIRRIQVARRRTQNCRKHCRKRNSRNSMEACDAEGSQDGCGAISQISIGTLPDQTRIRGPATAGLRVWAILEVSLKDPSAARGLYLSRAPDRHSKKRRGSPTLRLFSIARKSCRKERVTHRSVDM